MIVLNWSPILGNVSRIENGKLKVENEKAK